MDIREMRTRLGDTQSEFAARYNIPFRTVQNWEKERLEDTYRPYYLAVDEFSIRKGHKYATFNQMEYRKLKYVS